jgi:glycosyltransferase involved in cell wall biosynthesis
MWQGARQKAFQNSRPCDGDRKRGYLVETAFVKAKLPNSRLILKSLPLEGVSYDFRRGSVWYICKSFSPREMAALDALTDVFVWPTMGEGFGLPPLEKLAHGIPAFATFWSGPKDYQQDFPLKRLLPARLQMIRFNGALAEMADVDESSLIELIHDCYENRERLNELRPELFRIARRWDTNSVLKPSLLAAIWRICHEANGRQPSATARHDVRALQ